MATATCQAKVFAVEMEHFLLMECQQTAKSVQVEAMDMETQSLAESVHKAHSQMALHLVNHAHSILVQVLTVAHAQQTQDTTRTSLAT